MHFHNRVQGLGSITEIEQPHNSFSFCYMRLIHKYVLNKMDRIDHMNLIKQ